MATKYTGLNLVVSDKVDINKFRYDLVITYASGEATYQRTTGSKQKVRLAENKSFNNQGLTHEYKLPLRKIDEITYYIKLNGTVVIKVTAKPYSHKGSHSKYKLKTTPASSMKDSNTIKEVLVDRTEVAWHLVKIEETLDSFLNRIYKHTPSIREENIFRKNNPHLIGDPVLRLQPGDIVILANTNKENNELKEAKKQAKIAKDKIEALKKDREFDAEILAYNADILHDILLNAEYVAITNSPVRSADKPSEDINHAAIAAGTSQGIVTFLETSNKEVAKAYKAIIEAMEFEKTAGKSGTATKYANPKHFSEFKGKYAHLFKKYDNAFSQSFFKVESGAITNNLRRQLNNSAYARPTNYKGGIKAYVKNFDNMGKITRATKVGGNVLIAVSVADAAINVSNAYKTGDSNHTQKTIIKETLKLEGSLGAAGLASGGVMLAATVFGIGTGGIGFVIIGVCAAGAGVIGGVYGGKAGGMLADKINERI